MPTWGGILKELNDAGAAGQAAPFDLIRRRYMTQLHQHTNRNVILYASKFTQADPNTPASLTTIVDEDLQGIMEVVHGLAGPHLDLILHSPGGSPEAAEGIIVYLRSKFTDFRVIVPQFAMSAACMMACAADVIVMGKHSFLGPIDPQLLMRTQSGPRLVPAQAILDQFALAVTECVDPKKLAAWAPMLGQYGPDLLITCRNSLAMSRQVVGQWLEKYMFRGEHDAGRRANDISSWLADHSHFKSHGRHIGRDDLESRGLKIHYLETDQVFQDLVLSIFHATSHAFSSVSLVKVIENQLGKAFIKMQPSTAMPMFLPPFTTPMFPTFPAAPPATPAGPNSGGQQAGSLQPASLPSGI